MSEAATPEVIDCRPILESKSPEMEDLLRIRSLGLTEKPVRNQICEVLDELPGTLEEAGGAKAQIRTVGFCRFAIGQDKIAAQWLDRADNDDRTRHVLGLALIGAGRFATAAEVLTTIERQEPAARMALAEAHLRNGDPAAAKRAIGTLLKADAESAEGHYLNAYHHELVGEYEEAYAEYETALEADPEHGKALFRLAYCTDLDGHEDEAVVLYERLRKRKPTFTHALINLGVLYEDRGEYTKAMEVFQEIISVFPNHSRARRFFQDARASLNMYYDEDLERTEDRRAQILRIPISDFELSVRSRNCLAKMQIETLGDLIKKTEPELLSYKNFGETSLQEIKDILAQKGLRLGMGRDEQASSVQAAARTLLGIEPESGDALSKRIEDLELSVRSRNAMKLMGLETLGDLTKLSERDLMVVKNFGQTSMNEVKEKLAEFGLSLAESG